MNMCEKCGHSIPGDQLAYLCTACTRGVVEYLQLLPGLYVELGDFMEPCRRGGGEPVRVVRVEAPLPVSEAVLNLTSAGGIAGVLLDWERAFRDALQWPPPRPQTIVQTIASSALFLANNARWAASSFPAAGDFAREIAELVRGIESIVAPSTTATLRIGYCTTEADGGRCGAVLRATPGVPEIRCRWCGHSYGTHEWLALADAQKAA